MEGGAGQWVEYLLCPHRRYPALEADAAALHLALQRERATESIRNREADGARQCQLCGSWAESPASLGAHLAAVHVCSCRVCGLVMPSAHLLRLHEGEAHDATFRLLASGRAQVSRIAVVLLVRACGRHGVKCPYQWHELGRRRRRP